MSAPSVISHAFKVVVAGPFASGKSTLIRQISDSAVVGTEAPTTGAESLVKDTTTVGMEYGTLSIGDVDTTIDLSLFGVPGQERFRFMWDIVAPGSDGFLLMVDASDPDTWAESTEMAEKLLSYQGIPLVVAINRCSHDEALFHHVIDSLGIPGCLHVPVEAVDNQSAREAVVTLLLEVLDRLEAGFTDDDEVSDPSHRAPDDLAALDDLHPLTLDTP